MSLVPSINFFFFLERCIDIDEECKKNKQLSLLKYFFLSTWKCMESLKRDKNIQEGNISSLSCKLHSGNIFIMGVETVSSNSTIFLRNWNIMEVEAWTLSVHNFFSRGKLMNRWIDIEVPSETSKVPI